MRQPVTGGVSVLIGFRGRFFVIKPVTVRPHHDNGSHYLQDSLQPLCDLDK